MSKQNSKRKVDSETPSSDSLNDASSKKGRPLHPIIRIIFVTGNAKKLEEVKAILFNESTSNRFILTSRKLDLDEPQFSDAWEISEWKCLRAAKTLLENPDILKPSELELSQFKVAVGSKDESADEIVEKFTLENMPTFVLTEDTCLCFDALNGYPGPYIKWFLDKLGLEGLNTMIDGYTFKDIASGKEEANTSRSRKGHALCTFALTELSSFHKPEGKIEEEEHLLNIRNVTIVKRTRKNVVLFEGKSFGTIVRPRGDNAFGWDPIFQPEGKSQTFAEMKKEEKNSISHRFRALEGVKWWMKEQ
ncbi:hypothetical protein HK098_007149 [Nowakowskiella sp. JEL0407]|nr:hypothetical protein HK098_007149 [Nowakowskiella sp. JEL0407]